MSSHVEFGVFDRNEDVHVTQRSLPHWFQPMVATFITFRTVDSLPRSALEQWRREQEDWLRRHGLDVSVIDDTARLAMFHPQLLSQFRRIRDRAWHQQLDRGMGECVLRQPALAAIVRDALLHFDGERYDLDSFVVMPNHVHLLVQFRPPTTLRKQSASWLKFTATRINRSLGRSGSFWQSEAFDHLVRSAEQFVYLQNYIWTNPQKAKLQPGEFLYWSRVPRHSVPSKNMPRHSVP